MYPFAWPTNLFSPLANNEIARLALEKFKPGYASKLIRKDLNIAQSLAKNANMNNILGKNAKSIYEKFCNDGFENLDYAGIIKYLENN